MFYVMVLEVNLWILHLYCGHHLYGLHDADTDNVIIFDWAFYGLQSMKYPLLISNSKYNFFDYRNWYNRKYNQVLIPLPYVSILIRVETQETHLDWNKPILQKKNTV